MPKNKKKSKRKGFVDRSRPLPILTVGQDFAVCIKALGNRRFTIRLPDRVEVLAHLAGRVKRWQRVTAGTWVVTSLRPFDDSRADVFDVLTEEEVGKLHRLGRLSKSLVNDDEREQDDFDFLRAGEKEGSEDGDCPFAFNDI